MSALSKLKVGVLAAGLSCLTIGNAWAEQETEREYQRAGQQAAEQADRTLQQGQPHTAQFRGNQPSAGQSDQVTKYFASCMLAKNQAEVEIGQFAQQEAQNPEVKQFAQKMVQDHNQLIQKLRPLAGTQGTQSHTSPALGTQRQIDAQGQASDTTRLPGSPGAGQPEGDTHRSLTADRTAGQQNAALHEIAQIEKQIVEQCKQALREELQQKQGVEFDKCYIGSQVAGHMQMLAALEVLEQQGPNELQQIAQQASSTVEQHLQHAKQLMKQLEGGSSASQAERQPSRTQR